MDISTTLEKYLRDLQRIGKRERMMILGLLLFSFVVGFGAALIVGKSNINVNISTNPPAPLTPTPAQVVVGLASTSPSIPVGNTFDVSLNLSSPDRGIEAADFILYFDPKYILPTQIKEGDFFQNYPIKKVDKNFIKISTTASFVNKKITIPKGNGVVATITFTAVGPVDNTLIYFDPDATIVASEGKNVVSRMTNLNIGIR